MNEVSIRLQGGLGNYMFQIACAHAYGLKHNKKTVLSTDDSMIVHKHITNYKENILKNVELIPSWNHTNFKMYNEIDFSYNEIPNIGGSVYLNGYFQSEKYFIEYKEEIKNLFSFPVNIFDDVFETVFDKYKINLSEDNTCSIHVRRGDYLKLPDHHPTQNMNYYMKAIKQMSKDTKFLIFSDDISWCKENFPDIPEKFIFIEGGQDFEDLLMMSLCKNNITCNSTFSWWAAWLNNNPDKIVIAPSVWFGSAYSDYDISDLYCDGWIKI
jgi:hypothetical protein